MIHRIVEIYSDQAKAKPCINIASGTAMYDTMRNDTDDYHLHPGENKADMHRFADYLVWCLQLAVLGAGPTSITTGQGTEDGRTHIRLSTPGLTGGLSAQS